MLQPTMRCFKENKTSCNFVQNVEKKYKMCSIIYKLRHDIPHPLFCYVNSANNVEHVIDLVDVETDSDADNEEDLLNPGMKEAKKASKAMHQNNSNTRNKPGTGFIKRIIYDDKLEMGSNKRAKMNVSGVKN